MTTNFINVVGKYTLENVKELKDNIPVNENNVMDLTSAYIDENELNLKLNEYATKTFVLSETEPLNEDVNNIKNDLETKVSYESMQNYTKEYVDAKIGGIDNIETITESMESITEQINTLQTNKVDVTTFNNHTHDIFDEITATSCTINGNLSVTKLNDCNIAPGINSNGQSPQRPFIPVVDSEGVMEIGKFLDFHCTENDETPDNSVRLTGFLNHLYTGNNFSCANADVKGLTATSGTINGNLAIADGTIDLTTNGTSVFSVDDVGIVKAIRFYTNGTYINGSNLDTTILTAQTISANNLNGYIIPSSSYTNSSTYFGHNHIAVIKASGVLEVGYGIDFHHKSSEQAPDGDDYEFRLFGDVNGCWICFKGGEPGLLKNTTITHNAPINEDVANFQIGSPVFTTGLVYHVEETDNVYKYVPGSVSSIDCITSVKTSGSYRQYLGICTAIHNSGEEITVGDTIKSTVKLNQDTIDFATHGDFYFRVNDTSEYSVGDIVLFDGNKLDDDLVMTSKITSSIVGKVTGIIDEHLLCVFKD